MGTQLIAITRDGVAARVEWDAAIELHRKLEGQALGLERDTLAAFIRWGSLLRQIKASLEASDGTGRWLKFLDTAVNVKTAQKAMRLAGEAAGENGELDEGRAREQIIRHDATARERGVRPIGARALTRNSLEVAYGVRPGQPLKRSESDHHAHQGDPAKGSARNHDAAGGMTREQAEALMFGMPLDGEGAGGGGGGGGGGERNAGGTVTGASVAAAVGRTESSARGRSAGAAAAAPVVGEHATGRDAGGGIDRAPDAQTRASRVSRGGDVPGQMTLEKQYQYAASAARDLARMFDSHAVEPGLMARFVALVNEARRSAAGRW